jgi:hypothetical protein
MTREKFIKKWLGNKDYQYTEENRDLMRDDLDKVINRALQQPLVGGSLPMYDVEELNEIVKELNSGKLSLFDFVGKVWNKAYILGCIDGLKGNDH